MSRRLSSALCPLLLAGLLLAAFWRWWGARRGALAAATADGLPETLQRILGDAIAQGAAPGMQAAAWRDGAPLWSQAEIGRAHV